MSNAQVHVADAGTVFYAIVRDQNSAYVNISAASTRQIKFRKPDMTTLTKTAAYVSSYTGTDPDVAAGVAASAVMQYTSLTSDLTIAGGWQYQGFVVIGTGQWHTSISTFNVEANLA